MLPFVFLFVFIFGWKITALLDLISLSSFVLILYWYGSRARGVPASQIAVVVSVAIAVVYAAVVVTLTGAADPQVALRSVRALIALLAGIALVGIYDVRYEREALRVLVLHLYLAIALHGLIICAMYVNDGMRTWIYDAIGTREYVNLNTPFLLGLRVTGLTYGLASTSIVQAAGIVLIPAVLSMNRGRRSVRLLVLLMAPVLLASLFLTGRSGLAIAAVALPVIMLVGSLTSQGSARRIGSAALVLALAVGGLLISGLSDTLLPEKFAYNVQRATEILHFLDDPARSPTFLAVREMYFLPRTDTALLFGTGSLGRGDVRYIPSDSGIILLIFSVGVVGLILTVLPFLVGLRKVAGLSKDDAYLGLSAGVVLIASLLFSFKELALLSRNIWSVQVILIAAVTLVSRARWRRTVPAAFETSAHRTPGSDSY